MGGPPTDAGATNFVRSTQAHSGLQCPELAELRLQIVPWSTLCRADWVRDNGGQKDRSRPSSGVWLLRDARPGRGRGGPGHGLGNCHAERLGEAGITPIIHVQPVLRHECFERQVLGVVPMPHQLEAMKDTNVFRLGGRGNQ